MKDAQTVKLEYGMLTIVNRRTELVAHEPDPDGDICIDIRDGYNDETSMYLSTSQAHALRDFLNAALSTKVNDGVRMADYWLPKDEMLPQIATKTWPGKYAHQYIHVREVLPDTATITREELRKSLLSCVQKGDGSVMGMFDEIEMAIFDPQTPKAKGRE